MLRRLLPLLLLATPAAAQDLPPDQAAIKAHVQFLASDALKGRMAGSHEFDMAAEYVAAQMGAAGLKPAGDGKGGWFQPVHLIEYRSASRGGMSLSLKGKPIPMRFGVDFLNEPTPATPDFNISAGVVFAGYGLVYPQGGRDDYKGLDVRGKIVAVLPGAPGLPMDVAAYLGDDGAKAKLAETRGAKGVIVLESAARRRDFRFEDYAPYYDYPRNGWAAPDGKADAPAPNAPVIAYLSQPGAEKLFSGAKLKWPAVLAAEKRGTRMPTGALAVTLDLASKTKLRYALSHNVVGLLPGSDPALKSQYVILSAHLDHVGVGEPVNGDSIYNGAMDNAVGVGMILEIAKRFQATGERPKRSILFIAQTAEEEGLIGSDYFAHNPVVPKADIVADLNIDMPILTYKLQDLVVDGEERMSLGPTIRKAAAAEGLGVVPDPTPEEMFFVRSDHYSFVQAGIPAVSLDTGPGGDGAAAQKLFLANNYHKPSDQIDLPFDWPSAAKYLRVAYAVTRDLTDSPERPSFNKGDFFGVQFGGYGAQ